MGYDVMAAWNNRSFEFNDRIQERGAKWEGRIPFNSTPGRTIARDDYNPPKFSQITSRWSPPASPTSLSSPAAKFPPSLSPKQKSPSSSRTSSQKQSRASSPRVDSAISPASSLVSSLDSASLANKLYAASAAGDIQHMKLLISLGAPINTPTIVPNLYEAFKPAKPGRLSPLAGAAGSGCLEAVQLLVAYGAEVAPDINSSSSSPLQQACRANDLAIVRYLLDQGADVNQANCYKSTPLMYATKYGSPELLSLIIAHRPDFGALSFLGSSAPHWAIWPGRLEILELLLRAGANPDSMLADESTLLHCAALSGWTDGVKMLVNFSADPFRRDADYRMPLDVALANGHEDAADIIKAAMLLAS